MERDQEELQNFGFFATFKESFKIIFSWKKIFTQITLSLILPLSFVFLIQMQVSDFLFWKLRRDENMLHRSQSSSHEWGSYTYEHWSEIVTSDKISLALFKIAYYIVTLILSLLATSAVVYMIASIYTDKPVAFKKVMGVVPKVWKRLIVTFIWSFAIVIVLNLLASALFYLWVVNLGFRGVFGVVVFIILLIAYVVATIYIGIVWRVACVISVLEEYYGIKALFKSKDLIKGKIGMSAGLIFLVTVFYVGIMLVYQIFVVYALRYALSYGAPGYMLVIGLPCWLLLTFVMLVDFVLQTVIYFVCKSYHNESIDKPALADHLEAYNAQYEAMKSEKDVQMEQVMV
ncbi:uncharacterized protein LOC116210948 [Punica granatum]|uniref:Uncharacterized protein n=2 Tax=Punica granatum TaxID=22663 RepID=A0A218WVI7_PUNGR|nr:uncharacterized protein LOC116190165 [Punica granatum]XP_031400974.1 uncharacterized protein LOC116210948 [Punica granatum]OWM76370.1 hypothetical protein CDL15_Pgr028240 [Punica granatum]PKI32847.1 hypothetical protein CRG98_046756 [Punica granatum]